MSFEELERLWNDFKDIPIDKDECIDEPFHIWCKGTDITNLIDEYLAQ